MLEALRSAGVYHNLRDKLARELLAETGIDWLRQVLGWTAYLAAEGAASPRERGATVKTALTARQQVPDDTYLPPLSLSFGEAIAWAERGGQVQPVTAPPLPQTSVPALPEPAPPTDDEQLWRRVLAGLPMTSPARVIETMFADAALVRGPAPGVYTIITPSPVPPPGSKTAWPPTSSASSSVSSAHPRPSPSPAPPRPRQPPVHNRRRGRPRITRGRPRQIVWHSQLLTAELSGRDL